MDAKYWKGLHSVNKGKAFPLHAIKAYRGIRGIAPLILNLGTRWKLEDSGNKISTLWDNKFVFRQETASDIRINIKNNIIVKLYIF
jgi:hypothetical protein